MKLIHTLLAHIILIIFFERYVLLLTAYLGKLRNSVFFNKTVNRTNYLKWTNR